MGGFDRAGEGAELVIRHESFQIIAVKMNRHFPYLPNNLVWFMFLLYYRLASNATGFYEFC